MILFFFFKQKTAYDVRISDWSSDVCSSDLTWLSVSAAPPSPGFPITRRRFTSTTTDLDRPWLKLCLTLPVSTVRLIPSGARMPSLGLLSSFIRYQRLHSVSTGDGPCEPDSQATARLFNPE